MSYRKISRGAAAAAAVIVGYSIVEMQTFAFTLATLCLHRGVWFVHFRYVNFMYYYEKYYYVWLILCVVTSHRHKVYMTAIIWNLTIWGRLSTSTGVTVDLCTSTMTIVKYIMWCSGMYSGISHFIDCLINLLLKGGTYSPINYHSYNDSEFMCIKCVRIFLPLSFVIY